MNPLINRLTAKGVVVTEYENRGERARQEWKNRFISLEQQGHSRPYLWEYLVMEMDGTEATMAFQRAAKWTCLVFFQHSDDVLELDLTQAKSLARKDLIAATMDYADVYIVNPAYTWTYVIPHEADWGPYFAIHTPTEMRKHT